MRVALRIAAFVLLQGVCGGAGAHGQAGLAELEQRIERDYPGVPTMPPEALEPRLEDPRGVLILDVREAAEHAVSRIPGAERVDPGISAEEFGRRFGALLAGRTVVLYCSVGVRSSRLAHRISALAMMDGAAGVYNLRGGIFSWHNNGRPLVAGESRRTDYVHPYSWIWSRYLDAPQRASYTPRPHWRGRLRRED